MHKSGGCFKENDFKSQWPCNFEEVKTLTVEIPLEEEIREPNGGV